MPAIVDHPIDIDSARRALLDGGAGGYASYEGWVRDFNVGRPVTALQYEAYAAMAVKEIARILDEARARFDIRAADCIHRVGDLAIGDIAIWIGATAVHRGPAFDACRYIIDEVKLRAPIWKKETYADGSSSWVNCPACAAHAQDPARRAHHAHTHEHRHA